MQLDLMQVFSTLLVFSLVFAVVIITITGWPETKPKHRFSVFFYLSLLGLFGASGSGLFMYLYPWEFWFHFPSLLLGVVILGVAFPGFLAYRTVREETNETLNRFPIIVLQKSARNSLAVALAAIVSLIQITLYGELSNDLLFLGCWLFLIMILVTHNISTVYYMQRKHLRDDGTNQALTTAGLDSVQSL
ncbi:MAG: hypothetical protein ACXACG_17355 [Candidatus Thorarchaeota archaeon]